MIDLTPVKEIRKLLENTATIAIVGLSPKKERPSNIVAQYLLSVGFKVIPVNPGHDAILGLQCYPNLTSVPIKIDIADIFRKPTDILPVVKEAIRAKVSTVWMQSGIVNHQASDLARKNNINVIMDRCIKVDHLNLMT